ncbi:MAG: ribosome maturation factor RimM [Clostridia bacterium]|nr:ribosome maturation factor RimM [Clostridia bacterium]
MNWLEVGKIINTHGLKGEVKVVPWTDSPQIFEDIEYVYIKGKSKNEKLFIDGVKYQKNNLIVKFDTIDSIEKAEGYKGQILYAERDCLAPLPEGVYYIADLIGMTVEDENGRELGIVDNVFNTGSNDVYEVQREGRKPLLIPVIKDVVKKVDLSEKRISVKLMEGLEDL